MTAPVASGWSELAGWGFHPLESAAFARRTSGADSGAILEHDRRTLCSGIPRPRICNSQRFGLGVPTLENLARYIFERARAALPEVARVKLRRPSYGQTCVYEGPR